MFDRWCVTAFPDAVWVARRSGDALPSGAERIEGALAADQIGAWLNAHDGIRRDLLIELHEHIAGPRVHGPGDDPEALAALVREALREGRLLAYRLRVKLSGSGVEKPPEVKAQEKPTTEETTWVGIELVDDSSPPKPVAFAKYRIELPDGSTREGMLDDKGLARIDGIDPGDCQVTFPEYHGPDWKKV